MVVNTVVAFLGKEYEGLYEWNLGQILEKLKISENVQKTIPYSILKVPKNLFVFIFLHN